MSDRETLIEEVVSPHRERDPFGRIRSAPAWHDLDASDRVEAFQQAMLQRRLEAAADPRGLSGTARAVLARIRRSGP
jgi:hypothetical protein